MLPEKDERSLNGLVEIEPFLGRWRSFQKKPSAGEWADAFNALLSKA